MNKSWYYWPLSFVSAFVVAWIMAHVIVYAITYDHYADLQVKTKKLDAFLAQHGDIVTVALNGRYDDIEEVRSGKRYVTRRRILRMCRFPDGYIVVLEQTGKIPLDGEKWRVKVHNNGLTSQIIFDERLERFQK